MGYKRYIQVESEDLEAAHAVRFRGEHLADELPLTIRMKDGSEVEGRWYERREEETRDEADRWDGIELEIDDPRADLLEDGQPVSVRFPDATEIHGSAVYVREIVTGEMQAMQDGSTP